MRECIVMVILTVLVAVGTSLGAPGGNEKMLQVLSLLNDSDEDIRVLGGVLKNRGIVEPERNQDLIVEFVAVGLLKRGRMDLYNQHAVPVLKRRSLLERLCMRTCGTCDGVGEHELDCTVCNGTTKCLQCNGTGIKKTGGQLSGARLVRCTACRQDGNCTQCKGNGTFRRVCKACGRRRSVWSRENINTVYGYYNSFIRGALRSPEIMESVVVVRGDKGVGSGFLCEFDGRKFVASNAHVMIGNRAVTLTHVHGKNLEFGNIYMAKDRDVALFEILDAGDSAFLEIVSDTSRLQHGESIFVYGNSQGSGVATCLTGTILGVGPSLLETDAEFVSGNSGSPVVLDDKVVGIATFATMSSSSWVTDGTRFTEVRRFATRIDNLTMDSFDLIDMEQYAIQSAVLNAAKYAVDGVLSRIQASGLRVLTSADIDGLKDHAMNLETVNKWVSYIMAEEAKKYTTIIEAIDSAKQRGINVGTTSNVPEGEGDQITSDVVAVIDALLREQALGRVGFQYWYDSSNAAMLFAPVGWTVLETKIGNASSIGIIATSTVRVESSTKGGSPIRRLWTFRLRYTGQGWKVLSIDESY